MRVLDLFSGIGGFSLGLERAGMRTVAFCEIDPYCRAVLRKHWPDVPIHEDVRKLTAADVSGVDVICGGFPCQDISVAGKGAGIDGERSGLWSEYARLVGEIRPRYVIVENVAALLGRGLERVLGDLAALGYDAEWHCIPASAVGAPHRRDRVWIISYRHGYRKPVMPVNAGEVFEPNLAAAGGQGLEGRQRPEAAWQAQRQPTSSGEVLDNAMWGRREPQKEILCAGWDRIDASWWSSEPDVGRVAHGVPSRVDRLRSLGNAVVPQIPEIIGREIMGTH